MSVDSEEGDYGDKTDCSMRIGLQDLREQDIFIDYTIKVEDRQFPVHKVILASMSHYFRTLLTSALGQNQQESTTLDGVSAAVVEQLIECMYLNPMKITQENGQQILGGAAYLQIPAAIDICAEFLINNLTINNWLETMSLFRAYSLPASVKEVADFIELNIREILKDCIVDNLSYDDFSLIVKFWQKTEWDLYLKIKRWINVDCEKRKMKGDDLFSKVRFSLLSPEQITSIKEMQICIDAEGPWTTFVNKAGEYHQLPIHKKVIDESDQTLVRTEVCPIAFSDNPETKGYFYESYEEGWVEQDSLRTPNLCVKVFDVIEINNFLLVYVVSNQDTHPRWEVFDPRTMTWSTLGKMPISKTAFAVMYNNKKMYTIGGVEHRQSSVLSNSIEQFDFETNTWSSFAILPEPVQFPSACVFQNAIYISGGKNTLLEDDEGYTVDPDNTYDNDFPVTSRVDCFDHTQKTWQSKAPMLKRRQDHLMCVMKFNGEEVLCIIDDKLRLEYYDPANDQWSKCSLMYRQELPPTMRGVPKIKMAVRDNCIFLMDMEDLWFLRAGGMCVVLVFPEEEIEDRLEIQVDVLDEFPVITGDGSTMNVESQFTIYGLLSMMPSP